MAISDIIKERRKKLNMTQNQLAELIGVTPQAISKWENGVGCPDVSLLLALSKALEVSVDNMLGGDRRNELEKKWKEASLLSEEISFLVALEALEEFPDDETFLYRRACDEYSLGMLSSPYNGRIGRLRTAETHFRELCERFPDNDLYTSMLAETLFAQGRKDEARSLAYASKNDDLIEKFSEPEDRQRLRQKKIQENAFELYNKFLDYNTRESINVAYGLLDVIMGEEKELYGYYRSELCVKDALLYFDEGNYQLYTEKLTEAYEIAKAYDSMPYWDSFDYKNPLFDHLKLDAPREKAMGALMIRFLSEEKLAHSDSLELRRRFANEMLWFGPLHHFRWEAYYRFCRKYICEGNFSNFGTGWHVTTAESNEKLNNLMDHCHEHYIGMCKDEIEQFVSNGVMRGYIAMFNETIIAFCHCGLKESFKRVDDCSQWFTDQKGKKTLLIVETLIAHNFKGCGIEEKLIIKALNGAKKKGFTHAEIYCKEGLSPKDTPEYFEAMLELYKRMGFSVVIDMSKKDVREYLMQKEL